MKLVPSSKNIVLVVDDSPDSLGMINTALDQAGYMVLVALNGVQALTILKQIQPTVILLDAIMPVMNGFECCKKLRHTYPIIPVIFMTGLTETEDIMKAFASGGNDYITKPIRPQELLARIKVHTQNADFISDARAALDLAKQYIFSVDSMGRLNWATPEAVQLFKTTNIDQSAIVKWLSKEDCRTEHLPTTTHNLAIKYFKRISDDEHLLKFEEAVYQFDPQMLQDNLPITKREADVLLWLAQGKSNKEIALILALSPRTINKHLEQLYPKIEVDNRTAAASIAIKIFLEHT